MLSSLAGILLGLLVGLRHAFEPDHLSAVATLVTEARGARRSALVGAVWGVGHTISLFVVGVVLIGIGDALPDRVAAMFELCVSALLVSLGVRAIVRAVAEGRRGAAHEHAHATGETHT